MITAQQLPWIKLDAWTCPLRRGLRRPFEGALIILCNAEDDTRRFWPLLFELSGD